MAEDPLAATRLAVEAQRDRARAHGRPAARCAGHPEALQGEPGGRDRARRGGASSSGRRAGARRQARPAPAVPHATRRRRTTRSRSRCSPGSTTWPVPSDLARPRRARRSSEELQRWRHNPRKHGKISKKLAKQIAEGPARSAARRLERLRGRRRHPHRRPGAQGRRALPLGRAAVRHRGARRGGDHRRRRQARSRESEAGRHELRRGACRGCPRGLLGDERASPLAEGSTSLLGRTVPVRTTPLARILRRTTCAMHATGGLAAERSDLDLTNDPADHWRCRRGALGSSCPVCRRPDTPCSSSAYGSSSGRSSGTPLRVTWRSRSSRDRFPFAFRAASGASGCGRWATDVGCRCEPGRRSWPSSLHGMTRRADRRLQPGRRA